MSADVYLNARKAAAYIGYEPGSGPSRTDRAMRAFYEFCRRHDIKRYRVEGGRRLMFLKSDLDAAVGRGDESPSAIDPFKRMEELAREHARGGAVRHA